MRIDWYTKGVLTVIAALLAVIALRPYVGPEVVQAQGAFAGVQFAEYSNGSYGFFDARTGEIWGCGGGGTIHKRRLTVSVRPSTGLPNRLEEWFLKR